MRTFFSLQNAGRALFVTFLGVAITHISGAQVMSSTNYAIQSDSVNVGGGNSTSTNYGMESTVGEIATDDSSSTNYELRAGYQQMQEVYLSMSAPADVVMAPSLGTTDSLAGYQVMIKAANSPAMQSGLNTIADYSSVGAVPDFTFINTATSAQLAFSPEDSNVSVRYRDNGSVCGIGSGDTPERCWDGLGVTDRTVVTALAANHPSGATTTIRFQVGIGGSRPVPAGSYVATTTITALPL
jgi:hypothetical protein